MKMENEIRFADPDSNSWNLDNQIHVWKFPASRLDFSLLTSAEKEQANRFRIEEDSLRFSVGRHAVRFLLSKYLSVNPSEIILSSALGKKPAVVSPSASVYFNISHSGQWILIAFAQHEVGIDIERVDLDFSFNDFIEAHFSQEEKHFVSDSPDPVVAFYYLWTRKEALTKAWGTGLQENLKMISVPPEKNSLEMNNKHWILKSFLVTDRYPAALACSGALEKIQYLEGKYLFDSRQD